jgi:serine kinase of HPr protein (carbohydrate metabolism regulator)
MSSDLTSAGVMDLSAIVDRDLTRFADSCTHHVMHAALLRLANAAIAIMGDTGAGKSTLSAQLLTDGLALLTDDSQIVTLRDGTAFSRPLYRRLHLRSGPFSDRIPNRGFISGATLARMTRELAAGPASLTKPGRPLIAIFLLDPAPPESAPAVDRLPPARAVAAVLANSFAHDPTDPVRAHSRLAQIAGLIRLVPVWRLTSPRRPDALPQVSALVLATATFGIPDP